MRVKMMRTLNLIIFFYCSFEAQRANWDRECGKALFQPAAMKRWYIVYSKRLEQESKNLVERLTHLAINMQFDLNSPRR